MNRVTLDTKFLVYVLFKISYVIIQVINFLIESIRVTDLSPLGKVFTSGTVDLLDQAPF